MLRKPKLVLVVNNPHIPAKSKTGRALVSYKSKQLVPLKPIYSSLPSDISDI